jgi:hypothetical protein
VKPGTVVCDKLLNDLSYLMDPMSVLDTIHSYIAVSQLLLTSHPDTSRSSLRFLLVKILTSKSTHSKGSVRETQKKTTMMINSHLGF